jgi:hypothetical protein
VTASDPRHGAQAARPEDGKQPQTSAGREPQEQTSRWPAFVIELWANPQLREQNPGRPLSLREALGAGREPTSHKEPVPEQGLEIEP